MKKKQIIYIIGGLILLSMLLVTYKSILKNFFATWEGFRSQPYWDVSRWSWGYGTRVPGSIDDPNVRPSGTISRSQAWAAASAHVDGDYNYLKRLILRPLNTKQWAALLSFSYNLGPGNADNLVYNINAGDNQALQNQWMQYINISGEPSSYQVQRRAAEWQLFNS